MDAPVDASAPEAVCRDVDAAPVERPGHPLRALIEALQVRAWWDLSDPKAQLRIDPRLRRFPGVGPTGRIPDRNTLWRFDAVASPPARDGPVKRGLAEALLAGVDRQLREQGLVMRRGGIVVATLVESAASSKNRRHDGRPVDRDADRAARSGSDAR